MLIKTKKVTDAQIIEAATSSKTASEAAAKVGLNPTTYKYRALKLNVYKPDKSRFAKKILTKDILEGKVSQYQSGKLKIRLLEEGYKQRKCEICGLTKWEGKEIPLCLHHKDKNRYNNKLNNLQILCENCHALVHNGRK